MRRTLLHLIALAFLVAACSGASGSEDLYKGSSFDGDGRSDAGSSGGGSSSGGSSSGGPSSGGSSSGGSSSGGSSSGGSSSGGRDAGPPPDPGIYCGPNTHCTVDAQVCCADGLGGGQPPFYACKPATATCTGVPIACDDAADCPGEHCCGEFNPSTGYLSVSCRSACTGAVGGNSLVELCDPKATPATCTGGMTCQPSGSLLGFSVCK